MGDDEGETGVRIEGGRIEGDSVVVPSVSDKGLDGDTAVVVDVGGGLVGPVGGFPDVGGNEG